MVLYGTLYNYISVIALHVCIHVTISNVSDCLLASKQAQKIVRELTLKAVLFFTMILIIEQAVRRLSKLTTLLHF